MNKKATKTRLLLAQRNSPEKVLGNQKRIQEKKQVQNSVLRRTVRENPARDQRKLRGEI